MDSATSCTEKGRLEKDLFGVKALLRLHEQPMCLFGENVDAIWERLIKILAKEANPLPVDMPTGTGDPQRSPQNVSAVSNTSASDIVGEDGSGE